MACLGTCQGEVLPTIDVCGDGHDQIARAAILLCRPCSPDASCSDGDACTADACVDRALRQRRAEPLSLFQCRATALDQALASILTAARGQPSPRRVRQARRLANCSGRSNS
jgi:hypothetical protein